MAALPTAALATAPWIHDQAAAGDFAMVESGRAAEIVIAPEDFKVVSIAARDFAGDVERVTGVRPLVRTAAGGIAGPAVFAGTLGHSAIIDHLAATGKLDVTAVRGQWETFLIATVADPVPGVARGLVIVGSDRRGTAYGLYELSQAIGVSPWQWWADVTPEKRSGLFVAADVRKLGPPSVRYRGIFINDEDWGLQPWAAKTFAPGDGGIGPKTYARVFELLLRLKANTLWPAMHACTKPFNDFPADAVLADDYAIVMGSSHAEPMLRDNVGEWKAPAADYNYVTNRDGVRRYWEERVASNGRYENIYTLGMRGIHDSSMVGPKTDGERVATLEQIFADQRALLAQHVNPRVDEVPQMFCAYKEVLDLYRQGLRVPDDVTVVWPDDNFGYIRNFPTPTERTRSGGFGVYYHVSYLGSPLSYLWLCTTPPALIWEEMNKAYDLGARRIWILNVGDIKPAEIATEFFLEMAWDVNRWRRDNLPEYLVDWATREFGPAHAREIAAIMDGYYRLNFRRKPEHLQWWMHGEEEQPSGWSRQEIAGRLREFAGLVAQVRAIGAELPPETQNAFYELVAYPVRGSALANERYFLGERAALDGDAAAAAQAGAADAELEKETRYFNEKLANGKWNHVLALEPADDQWKGFRIARWVLPHFEALPPASATDHVISLVAGRFASATDRGGVGWRVVPGLGISGEAATVFPTISMPIPLERAATEAPRIDYPVNLPAAGGWRLELHLLPVHPIAATGGSRLGVAWDKESPRLVEIPRHDGDRAWAESVLSEERTVEVELPAPIAGAHSLSIYGLESGIVLDRLQLGAIPALSN